VTVATWRRVAREVRPFRRHLGILLALNLAGSALALLLPVPLKIAVDSVIGSHPAPGFLEALLPSGLTGSDEALLPVVAVLFVLIALLMQLQELGVLMFSTYTGERLTLGFRTKLFGHVQRLSLAYHDSRGTMDTSYRIQYDTPSVRYMTIDGLIPLVTSAVTVAGMVVVTAVIDWQLALVALGVTPILIWVLHVYGERLRRQWHDAKTLESSAFSVVQEVLGALRVVKAFGREDRERKRFLDRSSESVRAQMRLSLTEGALGMFVGLAIGIGTALVLYIGALRVDAGALTLGELLLVMTYLTQLYEPLRSIAGRIGDLQASVASAQRAFSVLDAPSDVIERPGARALLRARGAVELRDVSFAYEQGRPVLHSISLEVEPGTTLGIAGPTGAGKTTLVNLLTRFYDPASGRILLDGVDLRDYRLADLRNQFGIVLQEPVLFSTSIRENIEYGRPGAGELDVIAAAKAANAHDFIRGLPDGYETVVGERGMKLSGGERQRIGLARAFLKDAPILILDEPTSSVDVGTEAAIMDAMEQLMAGRTTFMIAHRLSTLAGCDVRVELEHGRVANVRRPLRSSPVRSASG
jgi:ATP-binding cassette, subfamily B, bacterial